MDERGPGDDYGEGLVRELGAVDGVGFDLLLSSERGIRNDLLGFVELLDDLLFSRARDVELGLVVVQKLAGDANVDGGLHFVPCEYSDFDPGMLERKDRIVNIFLELILDRSRTDELEVDLNLLLGLHHLLFPVL